MSRTSAVASAVPLSVWLAFSLPFRLRTIFLVQINPGSFDWRQDPLFIERRFASSLGCAHLNGISDSRSSPKSRLSGFASVIPPATSIHSAGECDIRGIIIRRTGVLIPPAARLPAYVAQLPWLPRSELGRRCTLRPHRQLARSAKLLVDGRARRWSIHIPSEVGTTPGRDSESVGRDTIGSDWFTIQSGYPDLWTCSVCVVSGKCHSVDIWPLRRIAGACFSSTSPSSWHSTVKWVSPWPNQCHHWPQRPHPREEGFESGLNLHLVWLSLEFSSPIYTS